jgi:hypothetical protein
MRRRLVWLYIALVTVFLSSDVFAGRRSIRIDIGAWYSPESIGYDLGGETCPDAMYIAWYNSILGKTYYQGDVRWPGGHVRPDGYNTQVQFVTSAFEGLNSFTCQSSRPYTPGAFPETYLNASILPADEAWLGKLIGDNHDNAAHATRYSFMGQGPGGYYGRQWVFYWFSNGRTVVALYGTQEGQATYEWIWDYSWEGIWLWRADENPGWSGDYFCFQDGVFEGYCEVFRAGFEE